MTTLKGTPFHPRTHTLCQSHEWQRWFGYLTAASYELHHEWEYHAIRGAAALIDISPLRKYRIRGPDAGKFFNRLITRDVSRLSPGRVLYTPWCDGAGKLIDDGTLQCLGPNDFRLTAADHNLNWLLENAFGMDVEVQDESNRLSALAIQGPASRAVLAQVVDDPGRLETLTYFSLGIFRIAGSEVLITRTGFTGDLGYEIWLEPPDALPVWDALVEAGEQYRLTPAGMHALGLARIEAGLILIDVDYISAHQALNETQKSSPYEIGLGWTVHLEKGNFNGRSALLAERSAPPKWRFVGLEVDWPSLEALYREAGLSPQMSPLARRKSLPLFDRNRQVGYATSSCYSPILKKYIAMGTVEAQYSRVGTGLQIETTVEHRRLQVPCRVVRTPFFDPPRKRDG